MKSLFQFIVVVIAAVGLFVACSSNLPLSADEATALAQVKGMVPAGTPAAAAEQLLARKGLKCFRRAEPTLGKMYLLCSIDDGGRIAKRRWLVQLALKEEKVTRHFVTIDLVGP